MCLEELGFLACDFAEEHVGEAACAESEPLVGEPLFAEYFLDDGVVGECVHDGVDATCGFETNLNARLLVVFLDGLAHDVCCFGSGCG